MLGFFVPNNVFISRLSAVASSYTLCLLRGAVEPAARQPKLNLQPISQVSAKTVLGILAKDIGNLRLRSIADTRKLGYVSPETLLHKFSKIIFSNL
jgi:hypothetical protein